MKTTFILKAFAAAALLGCVFTACDGDVLNPNADPFKDSTYKSNTTIPIADYIASQPQLSEYARALQYSGMYNALNQSTNGISFTAMVPDNGAMADFYRRRGVGSLEELAPKYVRAFVLYHTVKDSLTTDQFITKTQVSNLDGESLAVVIDPDHAGQADLGGEGHITAMGISAYNGTIYVLSSAVTPLVETVYDRIVETAPSTIMTQALQATGWDKELATLADTTVVNGASKITKRYYTFLSVSDAVFAQAGIHSLSDLRSRVAADDPEGVGADSLLNQYVSYHIIGSANKVADFGGVAEQVTERIMGSTARNQVMSLHANGTVADAPFVYTFNLNSAPPAEIDPPASDVRAKNGYVHQLNSWLPVWEPTQSLVVWDLADNALIRGQVSADNYQPTVAPANDASSKLSGVESLFDFGDDSGSVSYIASPGYRPRGATEYTYALNNDIIQFRIPYQQSVALTTPVLVKGKYMVELRFRYLTGMVNMYNQKNGSNGGLFRWMFDDDVATKKHMRYIKGAPTSANGFYSFTLYDEVEFESTQAHKLNITSLDPQSGSFTFDFDYISFIPVE